MKPQVFCRVVPVGGDVVFLQLFCIADKEMLPLTPVVAFNLKQIDESTTSEPFSTSGLDVKWLCIWNRDHSFWTRTWLNTFKPGRTLSRHWCGRPPQRGGPRRDQDDHGVCHEVICVLHSEQKNSLSVLFIACGTHP